MRAAIRLVVSIFALLVALGPSAPSLARMISGPPAHACHCDVRGGHGHCACPICFPELAARDAHSVDPTAPIATGACGDEDPAWRTLAVPGIPPSGFRLVAVTIGPVVTAPISRDLTTQWTQGPDPRPPRRTRG